MPRRDVESTASISALAAGAGVNGGFDSQRLFPSPPSPEKAPLVRKPVPFRKLLPVSERQAREFWFKLLRPKDECWIWKGAKTIFGHGRVKIAGELQSTHRVAFSIAKGDELVSGRRSLILHSCDNPACCNPEHLRLGTHRENVMDAIDRGRHHLVYPREPAPFLSQETGR